MTQRSPVTVLILSLVTFGIYGLIWAVSTKNEMNQKYGTQIPTGWFLILPVLNLLWYWKWSQGVEKVTGQGAAMNFILMLFLGPIGAFLIQGKFNSAGAGAGGMARAA